jgi:hypothetical protein
MRLPFHKRFAALALLAAIPLEWSYAASPVWTEFKAPDGSFSISFPGVPRLAKQKLIYSGKIADLETYGVAQIHAIYTVTLMDTRERDEVPEADVLSLGTSAGGETISTHDSRVGGHLTRDVLLRRGSVWEQIHIVVDGKRAYRVSAMMESDFSKQPETIRYFDSFTLLK